MIYCMFLYIYIYHRYIYSTRPQGGPADRRSRRARHANTAELNLIIELKRIESSGQIELNRRIGLS